jgi:phosphodiesterase/alkaline phosphatase D-like protein
MTAAQVAAQMRATTIPAHTGYGTRTVGAGIVMANVPQGPTVTTGAASAITSTSATLGGTVNPNGLSTTYIFLYGTSSSLAGASQVGPYSAGSGTSAVAANANISGLTPNTTPYYFRLQATNSSGPSMAQSTISTPLAPRRRRR